MWYVGLDVHLKQSSYCILDQHGKRVKTCTVRGSLVDVVQRNLHLRRLKELGESIREIETVLDTEAKGHPGVGLLRTIPGVGMRTAEAVVAWVDAPERFTHNKAIGRYFGLVPTEDTSAGKRRLGHITQDGPAVVRKLLNQAAWQAVRRSPEVRAFYERVRKDNRDRTRIALVATMHYLARVMLAMLRTGEAWRPLELRASA